MNEQPSPDRQVKPLGERSAARMSLDLKLGPGEEDAVQAQAREPDEHGWARPVLQREAQTVLLRT